MALSDDFNARGRPHSEFPVRIETPRLILREMEPEDADRILEMTTKPGFFYYCFDGTREKVDAFLQEAARTRAIDPETGMRENHMLSVVVKDTGELVGHVCLEQVHYVAGLNYEVNFFIDPDHQSKGYGREAAANLMHYGFQTMDMLAYTATVHPDNGPSQRVTRTEGYRKIADITIRTVRGEEPRDLFILTPEAFYEAHKNDKRPVIPGLGGGPGPKPAP